MKWLVLLITTWGITAEAKLKVVATTTDISALVSSIAGGHIDLHTLLTAQQDPHHVDIKASFLTKVREADVLFANGLWLEHEWLTKVREASKVKKYLELGIVAEPLLQKNSHHISNPHFTLDPLALAKAANLVADTLSQLDEVNSSTYKANATAISERLIKKTEKWKKQLSEAGIKKIFSYHSSFDHFLRRFQIEVAGTIEPKSGLAPSAQHLSHLIQIAKNENLKLVLVETFFDDKAARTLQREVPSLSIRKVFVAVGATSEIKTNEDLIEHIVTTLVLPTNLQSGR